VASNGFITVTGEFEGKWKEVVVVRFEGYFGIHVKKLRKSPKPQLRQ
jgi:hypothetical protein